jgi:hypothetical protein
MLGGSGGVGEGSVIIESSMVYFNETGCVDVGSVLAFHVEKTSGFARKRVKNYRSNLHRGAVRSDVCKKRA